LAARGRGLVLRVAVVRDNAEMTDFPVVVREQRRRIVVDDRAIELVPGERTDRVDRLPPCDDDDFNRAVALALQQPGAAVAGDGCELGDNDAAEVIGVLHRAFARRMRCPHPFDHPDTFAGLASPPTTTVQGRTRQLVTRPSRTYGSARAKSSTIVGESPRNTSSAPSGGWPSAPAMTS